MNGSSSTILVASLEYEGTIDKYMGDCVMAFWNAPVEIDRHPYKACCAALTMQKRMVDLNVQMGTHRAQQAATQPPLRMGVGVNTGPTFV